MKKYIFIISSLILIIGGIAIFRDYRGKGPVYGEGGIEVTYERTPLFQSVLSPGQSVSGRVTVTSTSALSQRVGLKLRAGRLADILVSGKFTLKVKDAASQAIIFGGESGKKLMTLFFLPSESQLFTLDPSQSREIDVIITMDPASANFYQGKGVNFDLSLGFIASTKIGRIR